MRGEANEELTYKYDIEEAREFNRVERGGRIAKEVYEAAPMRSRATQRNIKGTGTVGGAGIKGYDDRGARAAGRQTKAVRFARDIFVLVTYWPLTYGSRCRIAASSCQARS